MAKKPEFKDDLIDRINQLVVSSWFTRVFFGWFKRSKEDDDAFGLAIEKVKDGIAQIKAAKELSLIQNKAILDKYKHNVLPNTYETTKHNAAVLTALDNYLNNKIVADKITTWADIQAIATHNSMYQGFPETNALFEETKLIEFDAMGNKRSNYDPEEVKTLLLGQIETYLNDQSKQGSKHNGKRAVMTAIQTFLNSRNPADWNEVTVAIKLHEKTYSSGFYSQVANTVKKVELIKSQLWGIEEQESVEAVIIQERVDKLKEQYDELCLEAEALGGNCNITSINLIFNTLREHISTFPPRKINQESQESLTTLVGHFKRNKTIQDKLTQIIADTISEINNPTVARGTAP